MKKLILTISALLVSAAMVFSFAGCTGNEPTDEDDTNAGVVAEVDTNEAETA